jgi:uncharacterized protein (DUF58 family)
MAYTSQEFYYQVPWLARSPRPGRHRSAQVGSGMMANRSVPINSGADLRRLDIRARIADPMRRWWVRETLQRDAINVWVVADVSSSMNFTPEQAQAHESSLDLLRDFSACAAHSAFRSGDAFGLVAADDRLREDLQITLTRRAGSSAMVQQAFNASREKSQARTGANALPLTAQLINARRSLVFLVSDYLLNLEMLEHTLSALAHHHVVPVMLTSDSALSHLPSYGWLTLNDAETGQQRTLLMRPALKKQMLEAALAHETALMKLFTRHGLRPLKLAAPFDADVVTNYFFES